MNKESLEFIKDVLPDGRSVYYDFPDRFSLMLLRQLVVDGPQPVKTLRQSHLGPLLEKPVVKAILTRKGDGLLSEQDLLNAWPTEFEPYRLTIGPWPRLDEKPDARWSQVTRLGWSLVLQLNVSISHQRGLSELVPSWRDHANYGHHPVAGGDELTLAWSRIDLDLDKNEALIEELQSDWVRDVKENAANQYDPDQAGWVAYQESLFEPVARRWSETMLTATLWFLLEELGIGTIFYHTYDSGTQLKGIEGSSPPRSLYTSLPKKFCFTKTHHGPLFIYDSARSDQQRLMTDPETVWFMHDFS